MLAVIFCGHSAYLVARLHRTLLWLVRSVLLQATRTVSLLFVQIVWLHRFGK